MYRYSVAIVDDEDEFRKTVMEMFTAYQSESKNRLVIHEFKSAEELLLAYKERTRPFQILILDVEMQKINGAEAAKRIREMDKRVSIIFTTGYPSYAVDAFAVDAVGFLVKPVSYIDLKSQMAKAIINVDYLNDKLLAETRYLSITSSYNDTSIEISRIYYIEKRRNQCIFHTMDGEYSCYDTLAQIQESLNDPRFTYCHQGYIINFDQVKSITREFVKFSSHMVVPISKKYYTPLKTRLLERINIERERALLADRFSRYTK